MTEYLSMAPKCAVGIACASARSRHRNGFTDAEFEQLKATVERIINTPDPKHPGNVIIKCSKTGNRANGFCACDDDDDLANINTRVMDLKVYDGTKWESLAERETFKRVSVYHNNEMIVLYDDSMRLENTLDESKNTEPA